MTRPESARRAAWIAAILLLWPARLLAQPTGRIEKRIEGYDKPVLAFVPQGYTAARTWGLVLCLHGTGMSGPRIAAGCDVNKINGAGYILVCPTSLQGAWASRSSGGTEKELVEELRYTRRILETFMKEYNIHPDKVHTVGFSAGTAFLAVAIGFRSEWDGIKIRSLCGHSGGLGGTATARPDRAKETAVWILNGSRDSAHAKISRNIHEAYEKAGYDSKFTEVPGRGHDFPLVSWDKIVAWWKELDKNAPNLDRANALLKRAEAMMERKQYGRAYSAFMELKKEVKGKSERLLREAEKGLARIDSEARKKLDEARSALDDDPRKAKKILRDVRRRFRGTPYEEQATKILEGLD